jgi:hypothetical protein
MSDPPPIAVPAVSGLGIELREPHTLRLTGTITAKQASQDLAVFFKSLHRDAVARGISELRVDVTELTFVNASSIRLFIDWAVWVRDEPRHRYMLRFVTSRQVMWQETSFSALASLMTEVVSVERT